MCAGVVSGFPSACILFHRKETQLTELAPALAREHVSLHVIERPSDVPVECDRPAVLLVDDALAASADHEQLPEHIIVLAADEHLSMSLLRTSFELSASRLLVDQLRADLHALARTGMALMSERDHDVLLRRILEEATRLTDSDGAILFLLEERTEGQPRLHFKMAHSESVPAPSLEDVSHPIDSTTVAGYAAQTHQPLVIDDAHHLPADVPFGTSGLIEKLLGYWVKSALTVPMVDHRDKVVGVLQLANRKKDPKARIRSEQDCDRHVIPYSRHDITIAFALAGQAAVSIENANLHRQIEQLFESFTKAAVTAIDQRDPTTAGHSLRVATLVVDLACALERSHAPAYRTLRFTREQIRELRYAALLHDFGKVGVREEVLVKARKLPPVVWERVHARFDLIRCANELEFERKRSRMLATGASYQELLELAAELEQARHRVDRFYLAVRAANEPSLAFMQSATALTKLSQQTFERPDGGIEAYLNAEELHFLHIPHGTLDESERREIETHALQTYQFLSQMPWTDDLKQVPVFASTHHEKLNGSGYPNHLRANAIPVQTRIMTVADIFDALTAADRPYKHAVPADAALDILRSEAKAGSLDADVVQAMIESQVYRRVLEEDWTTF